MKGRAHGISLYALWFFAALAFLFWMDARFTHLNCCSQEWIDTAPTAGIRVEREQARARAVLRVQELKRRSQLHSASCLAVAMGFFLLYRKTSGVPEDVGDTEGGTRL